MLALILSACGGGGGGGGGATDSRPAIAYDFVADSGSVASVPQDADRAFAVSEGTDLSSLDAPERKLNQALTTDSDVTYALMVTDDKGMTLTGDANPFALVEDANNVKTSIVEIRSRASDFDHETIPAYKLTVTLSKDGHKDTSVRFDVRIGDVDDTAPTLDDGGTASTTLAGGTNAGSNHSARDTGLYVDLVDVDTDFDPTSYKPTLSGTGSDKFELVHDASVTIANGARYKLRVKAGADGVLASGVTYSLTVQQPATGEWASQTVASDVVLDDIVVTENSAATGAVVLTISDEDNDDTLNVGDIITADISGLMDANGIDMSTFNYEFYALSSDGTRASIQDDDDNTYTIDANDSLTSGQKIRVVVTFTDAGGTDELAIGITDKGLGDIFYTETLGTSSGDTLDHSTATTPQLIKGLGGNDTITGGSASDLLDGGAGVDTLNGGAGDDTLIGGAGIDDILNGGAGDDIFVLGARDEGRDLVLDFASGDKVRIDTVNGNETTLLGLRAAGFNWAVSPHNVVHAENGAENDTLIYVGSVAMILLDFTIPSNDAGLVHFDIV